MKAYINPKVHILKMEIQDTLMTLSQSEKEIDGANAGLVKGNDASSRSDYNVWNDDWSK